MMSTRKREPGDFAVFQISGKANELIADLQQADFEFARCDNADTLPYSTALDRKRSLVEYLELLEFRLGITPTVALRF